MKYAYGYPGIYIACPHTWSGVRMRSVNITLCVVFSCVQYAAFSVKQENEFLIYFNVTHSCYLTRVSDILSMLDRINCVIISMY